MAALERKYSGLGRRWDKVALREHAPRRRNETGIAVRGTVAPLPGDNRSCPGADDRELSLCFQARLPQRRLSTAGARGATQFDRRVLASNG